MLCIDARAQLVIREKGAEGKIAALVKEYFAGDGIRLVKVTYRGNNEAVGSFTDETRLTGFSNGLVLATGRVELIAGKNSRPNTSTNFGDHFFFDEDFVTKAPQCDGAVLEIDFIPAKDSICFSFIFGSEEYPEFVGKEFNDMFRLLLQPLFAKAPARNLARLPDKKMVSINNINPARNSELYIDNTQPANPFYHYLEFDGFTQPLIAASRVAPGKLYRLKIMIADLEDCEYDSGVLLQAYSLRSVSSKPRIFKPVKRTLRFQFETGSSELSAKDLTRIKKLTDSLSRFTFDSIVITGHTDNNGTEEQNKTLSLKRAQTVARYFRDNGVKSNNFVTNGDGQSQPVATNDNESGMALNRRVEIILYRKPE
jgi:outer membrane protein OmpA-like peptidoglycan-associated protein